MQPAFSLRVIRKSLEHMGPPAAGGEGGPGPRWHPLRQENVHGVGCVAFAGFWRSGRAIQPKVNTMCLIFFHYLDLLTENTCRVPHLEFGICALTGAAPTEGLQMNAKSCDARQN